MKYNPCKQCGNTGIKIHWVPTLGDLSFPIVVSCSNDKCKEYVMASVPLRETRIHGRDRAAEQCAVEAWNKENPPIEESTEKQKVQELREINKMLNEKLLAEGWKNVLFDSAAAEALENHKEVLKVLKAYEAMTDDLVNAAKELKWQVETLKTERDVLRNLLKG